MNNQRCRGPILPSIAFALVWLLLHSTPAALASGPQRPAARDFAPTDLPHLLADLRTAPQPTGSNPVLPLELVIAPGPEATEPAALLFVATDDRHGLELWQLAPDGTPRRLTDICPGPCDSLREYYPPMVGRWPDGRVVVNADDGETGEHLWLTDGSESAARRLTPLRAEVSYVDAVGRAPLGNFIYFSLADALWRTDGTPEGTSEFEFAPGAEPMLPRNLVRVGDRLAFTTFDLESGDRLWSTDGTPEGTVSLPIGCSVPCGTSIGAIAGLGDDGTGTAELLVFSTWSSAQGHRLWSTAGTVASTRQIADLCLTDACFYFGFYLQVVGERLAFALDDQVWWTDGTPEGSQRVATLPDSRQAHLLGTYPGGLVAIALLNGDHSAWRLPTAGGVPATPVHVADLPGYVSWGAGIPPNGPLVFSTETDDAGYEVWITDGSAAGTRLLADLASGSAASNPTPFRVWNDSVVFTADDRVSGRELYVSDGTEAGTARVADLRGQPGGSQPRELVDLGDRVLFVADAADTVPSSPNSEPEPAGDLFVVAAQQVVRLAEGAKASGLTPVGDHVFFAAENLPPSGYGSPDLEPWITDGTPSGTRLLAEIEPGGHQSYPRDPVLLPTPERSRVLFFADQDRGARIWITDASLQGVELVTDIDPTWDNVHPDEACTAVCSPPYPPSRIYPRDAHLLANRVVFIGHDPEAGEELWITDGTAAGTTILADLLPGPASSFPADLTIAGDRLFFSIGEQPDEVEFADRSLWVTDGSEAGTLVLSSEFGAVVGMVPLATPSGPRVVFLLHRDFDQDESGYSLWISDGTQLGTDRIATFDAPVGGLTAASGLAYFTLQTAGEGTELMRTDGTEGGTFAVADLRPGERGSLPRVLATRGSEAIFSATDGSAGNGGTDLWITDGSAGDARRLVTEGPRLEAPTAAHVVADGRIFVAADDGVHGSELWTIGDAQPALCERSELYHCLSGRFRVHVGWRVPATGQSGLAHTLPGTADTGFFWFFGPENVELAVKVLDGTSINDHHWLFYGALSNVEYTIVAEDLLTGTQRAYVNPGGNLCGGADIEAFREPNFLHGDSVAFGAGSAAEAAWVSRVSHPGGTTKTSTCGEGENSLCLQGRFEVSAVWQTADAAGNAQPIPFGDSTGMFWFFGLDNVELLVKILDGRTINGKFWVFYGALSNVEYTIRVLDTGTGDEVTYFNPAGNLCGGADVGALGD